MLDKKRKGRPVGAGLSPAKTKLGKYIRTRRLKLHVGQVLVSKDCDCGRDFVSRLERGLHKFLSDCQLERLASVLRCNLEELQKLVRTKQVATPTTALGRCIRSRREELDLSIEVFAERMKISPQRAKEIEMRMSPRIQYDTVRRLSSALNLDSSFFSPFAVPSRKKSKSKLGNVVRSRRKEFGMSLDMLAVKLDVSRQLVDQIELGICPLSENDSMLIKLAQILELNVAVLEAKRPQRKLKQLKTDSLVGRRLGTARLGLHLTQQEVAKRAKITPSVVCAIETGRRCPGRELLENLSKVLKCQIPRSWG